MLFLGLGAVQRESATNRTASKLPQERTALWKDSQVGSSQWAEVSTICLHPGLRKARKIKGDGKQFPLSSSETLSYLIFLHLLRRLLQLWPLHHSGLRPCPPFIHRRVSLLLHVPQHGQHLLGGASQSMSTEPPTDAWEASTGSILTCSKVVHVCQHRWHAMWEQYMWRGA